MNSIVKKIPLTKSILQKYHKLMLYRVTPQHSGHTTLYNYCSIVSQDLWIPKFIEEKRLLEGKSNVKVSLFSVFGLKSLMKLNRGDVKLFFARENVHRENWKEYADLCLSDKHIDLSIGFDYLDALNYIRLPLWIMWLFPPSVSFEELKTFMLKVNSRDNSSYENRKFCSFLCSHNDVGRKQIFDEFSAIGRIDCDGKLFHNNDELKCLYQDDEYKTLRYKVNKFRFLTSASIRRKNHGKY